MKIGDIDLGERPVFLAPMEDVTDIGFRLLCKRFGAAMVYTEFVSAEALVRSVKSTVSKLTISDEERPVGIQIYGRDVPQMVEAARIDGSNEFKIFNQIVLPIMKPAVAVQMIFSFVGSWNNYFMPALLLNDAQKKTVPVMIATLRSADYSKFDMGKVYMLILLAILPVMVVYIILSKAIIKGVTAGSVKG